MGKLGVLTAPFTPFVLLGPYLIPAIAASSRPEVVRLTPRVSAGETHWKVGKKDPPSHAITGHLDGTRGAAPGTAWRRGSFRMPLPPAPSACLCPLSSHGKKSNASRGPDAGDLSGCVPRNP